MPFISIVLVPSRFEPLGRSTVFFLNSIILPCHCTDINNIFTFYLTFTFERTVLWATLTIAWIPIFFNSSRIIFIIIIILYIQLYNYIIILRYRVNTNYFEKKFTVHVIEWWRECSLFWFIMIHCMLVRPREKLSDWLTEGTRDCSN